MLADLAAGVDADDDTPACVEGLIADEPSPEPAGLAGSGCPPRHTEEDRREEKVSKDRLRAVEPEAHELPEQLRLPTEGIAAAM
jgi:hypothetical protein